MNQFWNSHSEKARKKTYWQFSELFQAFLYSANLTKAHCIVFQQLRRAGIRCEMCRHQVWYVQASGVCKARGDRWLHRGHRMSLQGLMLTWWAVMYICWVCFYQGRWTCSWILQKRAPLRTKVSTEAGVRTMETKDGDKHFWIWQDIHSFFLRWNTRLSREGLWVKTIWSVKKPEMKILCFRKDSSHCHNYGHRFFVALGTCDPRLTP